MDINMMFPHAGRSVLLLFGVWCTLFTVKLLLDVISERVDLVLSMRRFLIEVMFVEVPLPRVQLLSRGEW